MNIFYLDSHPKLAAEYHCDKHVVKMCVEYAQLLSSAVRVNNPEICTEDFPYKLTHKNHPCAIWVRSSLENFFWLRKLTLALGNEYTHRYKKHHKSILIANQILIPSFPSQEFTEPPQCVPEDCKDSNVVVAYRNYYIKHKARFAKWKTGEPVWWPK